jgi:hypothetical protein
MTYKSLAYTPFMVLYASSATVARLKLCAACECACAYVVLQRTRVEAFLLESKGWFGREPRFVLC